MAAAELPVPFRHTPAQPERRGTARLQPWELLAERGGRFLAVHAASGRSFRIEAPGAPEAAEQVAMLNRLSLDFTA